MLEIDESNVSQTSVTSAEASSESDLTIANSSISSNSQASLQLEEDVAAIDSSELSKGFWITTDSKTEFHWRNTVFHTDSDARYAIRLSSGGVLDSNVKTMKIQEETPSQLLQYDELNEMSEERTAEHNTTNAEISDTSAEMRYPTVGNDDLSQNVSEMSPEELKRRADEHAILMGNYDMDVIDSSHSLELIAVPYDYELTEIHKDRQTIRKMSVAQQDTSSQGTSESVKEMRESQLLESILQKGNKKKDRQLRVRGLGWQEKINVTVMDSATKLYDEKVLQIVSGVPFNATPDLDVVESEFEQKVTYTESEEIVRDILVTLIKTFPSPSLMAIGPIIIPKPEVPLPYFTTEEVVLHNQPTDIWVSFLGNVYDITSLIKHCEGRIEVRPLLAFAGKDISHWFDSNGELRHYVHPLTGVRVPYLPHGPIPETSPQIPATSWQPVACPCRCEDLTKFVPWWRDHAKYRVGKLTKKDRPIRILNMLTRDECTLTVCDEDKLSRICERLALFNSHGSSYTWKYHGRVLNMDKTLDENRIYDEREEFLDLFLPDDTYIPAIALYFNDDLVWDEDTDDDSDTD